ncbi:hypothetical protein [Pseudoduganella umbonata]|uniref:Uncharacterized protein n=1 Tax=Pseudoduganella umbonata TaxID=864828 RepID=A0A4P8HM09_9BURK|nr:hypothetical protein [Pseudoduganella umbonata]MBB3219987.1 hypothetical protein [Pseudoduganella umbonata]QCP09996.1 hypothetical protein FCL38_05840 [Pseudoduganella umbonata]
MTFLEYLPIALAVTGLVLRFVISKPAAQAVQAWEQDSRLQREAQPAATRPAVSARERAFAAA